LKARNCAPVKRFAFGWRAASDWVDSSPLVFRFEQLQQQVPITAIDSLWLRRRATGRGALVGGIVVGGASFAFLTVVCQAI